jgi:hypothetical protein
MLTRSFVGVSTLFLLGAGCSDSGPVARECSPTPGTACTWAGVVGSVGFNGDSLDRRDTWFYFASDLTFAPDGSAWVADWNNHRVRRVGLDGKVETVIGTDYEGDGSPGETDRLPAGAPAGAPGNEIALNHPMDVEFFPDGRVLLAAWHNNKIRVYDPATKMTTVLAGNSYGFAGDGGPAYKSVFNLAKAVAVDTDGTVYMVDQRNQRVRKITNEVTPMISTIAGTGVKGALGDGGPAAQAQLGFDAGNTPVPSGSLAIRGQDLFIANSANNSIRRINFTTGMIDCVAGCTVGAPTPPGYTGDGGSALAATFNFPIDIEFGPDGRLYVADRNNNAIRAIDLEHDRVETVAGNGKPCVIGASCVEAQEGLAATEIQLNDPYGVAFDAAGNLFIADTLNSRIVRVAR